MLYEEIKKFGNGTRKSICKKVKKTNVVNVYWSRPLFWDVWEVIPEPGEREWTLSFIVTMSLTKLFTELHTTAKESFSKCHPASDSDRKPDSQLVKHVFQ